MTTNTAGPRRQPQQLTDAELAREFTRIKETLAIMPVNDGRVPALSQTLRSLQTEQDSRHEREPRMTASGTSGFATSHKGLRKLGPGLLSDAINATEILLQFQVRQCLEPITATKLDSLHADLLAAYEDVARQTSRDMGAPIHPDSGPHPCTP